MPATRLVLATAIVRISSSEKPAARYASAISASPSSTGGFAFWPRSVAQTVCCGPTARVASNTLSHATFPVYGVVNARSMSAPMAAISTWSAGAIDCDGNSGCVTTMSRTPRSVAASTRAKTSSRPR